MLRGVLVLAVVILSTLVLAPVAGLAALVLRHQGAYWWAVRLWSALVLLVSGVRVIAEGTERLRDLRGAVIVANHSSNFDIHALHHALGVRFRWIAKASLFRIPALGFAMRAFGFVSIEREDRERAIASLGPAVELLRAGDKVAFFPEGTRSRDGRLRAFKKGAFMTAIHAGVPVVPVAINGSHRVQRSRGIAVRPGTVRVVVGEPLSTEGLDRDDRNALLTRSRDRLLSLLDPAQH